MSIRRHTTIQAELFLTDPWPGNSSIGGAIISGLHVVDDAGEPLDLQRIFAGGGKGNQRAKNMVYAYSFAWMRDIQALGGSTSIRFARNLVTQFIDGYRKTRKFWLRDPSFEAGIIGERLVNWMFAYPFFAASAGDSFQKKVLTSINEQFSHLCNVYAGKIDRRAKLLAMEAIFLCLCAMSSPPRRRIEAVLGEIFGLIRCDDTSGAPFSRNPCVHFCALKSLIEIRFMAKKIGVDFRQSAHKMLSQMAFCIRHLRLGDGRLSNHFVDKTDAPPSKQMVDSALFAIDVKSKNDTTKLGVEKLATKTIVMLVSTEIAAFKSKFNSGREPGINIFNIEASFGANRVINRGDVAVILAGGNRVRLPCNATRFVGRNVTGDIIEFSGNVLQKGESGDFSFRRNLFVNHSEPRIGGSDFVQMHKAFEVASRFVFARQAALNIVNQKTVSITVNRSKYLFKNQSANGNSEMIINDDDKAPYPSIEIVCWGDNGSAQIDWQLEEVR